MKTLFRLLMVFLLTAQVALAQRTVSGVVSDADGIPLPGATVVIQGSSTGVTTDFSLLRDLKEYAYGFSSLNDLVRIQELIISINNSSNHSNPLIIAGAGPTGVELACKLSDLVNNRVEIYLVDKGNKILSKSKSFNRLKSNF